MQAFCMQSSPVSLLFIPLVFHSTQHVMGEHLLYVIHVHRPVELLSDAWFRFAGYPDLQFRFQVEGAGSFYAEPGDALVVDRLVFPLFPGHSLHIDDNQVFV